MEQEHAGDLKPNILSVKRVAYIAIFIALSAVGAMIKIPSPAGTIGLDAAPGYFCALAFGYVEGVSVIFIGHLLTSGIVGFPLGLPLHIFIAVQMGLWAVAFRWVTHKFGMIPGTVIAVLLNGVVSAFTLVFVGGMGAALGVMPFLVAGSLINVVVAVVAYKGVHAGRLI
ncbi:ECF transporter S component [Desulfobacula sp.]|uniref:ECF transporter S component n=1 Tax=Desulfobacula sp. TaxID=2593537 RepID=UPI0026046184|nr:ECF transporter S component [Desulfobacula sp.]